MSFHFDPKPNKEKSLIFPWIFLSITSLLSFLFLSVTWKSKQESLKQRKRYLQFQYSCKMTTSSTRPKKGWFCLKPKIFCLEKFILFLIFFSHPYEFQNAQIFNLTLNFILLTPKFPITTTISTAVPPSPTPKLLSLPLHPLPRSLTLHHDCSHAWF